MTEGQTHLEPYWWQEAPPVAMAPTPVEPTCDVVIVGAGFTGLSAALTLARAGKSVQVLDKDRIFAGASSRNGGITSGSIRLGFGEATRLYGVEKTRSVFLEARNARQHLKQLIEDEKIDCDYQLNGLFTGALGSADLESMKREAALVHKETGLEIEVIERDRLSQFSGSGSYVGGIHKADVGTIHPGKLAHGLMQRAQESGALIHSETPVLKVTPDKAGFIVETARGKMHAKDVLMATNGYTDGSDGWLRRRLVPVKSRIVVTEELSENLVQSLIPDGRAQGEKRNLYRYYRATPDGKRILLGAREPAWQNDPMSALEHVRCGMASIFPQLEDKKIEYSWNGHVAFSRRALPALFSRNGIHYAVGYCGSGTVWAPWLGRKAALSIMGDEEAESPMRCEPPPLVPFYNGHPWFLPLVISYYGATDWWKKRR